VAPRVPTSMKRDAVPAHAVDLAAPPIDHAKPDPLQPTLERVVDPLTVPGPRHLQMRAHARIGERLWPGELLEVLERRGE
jgi:hypothetical protein